MAKLYLTRHGETEWNVEGRMQGRQNSLLTKRGREQASWLSERLNNININLIISSPSARALETAEIIRGTRDIEIVQDEHFLEINVGDWEGCLKGDIEKKDPDKSLLFWTKPHLFKTTNGEDFYQVRERVLPWLKHILNEYQGQEVLIVTHAIVLKIILSYFNKTPLERLWEGPYIEGTSLTTVEISGEDWKISQCADTSHFKIVPMKL
ncbi:phosphoglycerate mutase [Scopulibacillus darangshiensis]|uniref:Phosphoglycerate mutase n=1 Tax=Scopulibacillus darangshiensis TaxID=442528 RepID=A0A4R2P9P6_9BACL|nr:histidine phosphatase family protein [Scopulibacillus darangshiensis]TCP30595.1 phosphoglycerate mutase [Scopulibacillus darangshiensis]